ncbi:FAD binding domain protein [Xylariaceae sp. FL0594]|nr:FAD binding domain protein [Xylariaceae sp. FL0594]
MPKSIVIVGGSLAGLMEGLQFKRRGENVVNLEQDPRNERCSNEAGIAFGTNLGELLTKLDRTGVPVAILCEYNYISFRKYSRAKVSRAERSLSSWGLLYRVLRASYDRHPSSVCPSPPAPLGGDGRTGYRPGKRVTDLQHANDGTVTVHFEDVETKKRATLEADLVIGADGVHSTVRKLVAAPAGKKYSGYIVWRGIVPYRALSAESQLHFSNSVGSNVLGGSYCICYVIPSDNGGFTPERRLLNWLMKDIFTDINGRHHPDTVPRGLVRLEVWERIRAKLTSEPVADLLFKTDSPFVTKVNDVLCTTPSFHDGRVVLVGDALTTIRPYIGHSAEQAASHTLSVAKGRQGEKTQAAWSREVGNHALRFFTLSRVVGHFGQGPVLTFLKSLFSYIWLLIRLKFGRK